MARREKITINRIEALTASSKTYFLWDTLVPNLAVMVRPSGHKSWIFQYVINGDKPRKTIGSTLKLSPDQARSVAKSMYGLIANGIDPRQVDRDAKSAAQAKKLDQLTVSDLLRRFMAEHCETNNKPNTIKRTRTRIDNILVPALGKIRLRELDRDVLVRWRKQMASRPGQFNQCRAILSTALNLAVNNWGLLTSSPLRGIEKYPSNTRSRYLNDDEYVRMLRATALCISEIEKPGLQTIPAWACRALLARGLRISETIGMEWTDIDFQSDRINLPDSKVGKVSVPIGPYLRTVLEELKGYAEAHGIVSKFVFPSPRGWDQCISYSAVYRRLKLIAVEASVDDVSPHTTRATMATRLANNHASSFAIQAAFAWKSTAMPNRYVKDASTAAQAALNALPRLDAA